MTEEVNTNMLLCYCLVVTHHHVLQSFIYYLSKHLHVFPKFRTFPKLSHSLIVACYSVRWGPSHITAPGDGDRGRVHRHHHHHADSREGEAGSTPVGFRPGAKGHRRPPSAHVIIHETAAEELLLAQGQFRRTWSGCYPGKVRYETFPFPVQLTRR